MKRILVFISCFIAIWSLSAQSVQWGNQAKLKKRLFGNNWIANAKYIGSIDGTSYYAESVNRLKLVTVEDTRFIFFASEGTRLSRESELTQNTYEDIDVGIFDEQIYVLHSTTAKKGLKTDVKLDLYNPNNFKKGQTRDLFSFVALDKDPYVNFVKSENGNFSAFVMSGINPSTGEGTLILKCFNKEFNEAWTHYYDYNGSGYPEIGDLFLSNSGELVLHVVVFNDKKKMTSFDFIELSTSDSKFVSFPLNSPKMELMDYKVGAYGAPHQYLFVYTENMNMVGFKVDFNEGGIDPVFTKQPYDGDWKIDQIVDLGNGKHTVAFQNRNVIEVVSRKSNGMVERTYFYWNRSFRFIGLNSETNEIVYDQTIGRKYNQILGYFVYEPFATVAPYYFAKDGKLHVVYNTDRATNEKECKKHERPSGNLRVRLSMATLKPVAKMIVVDEVGDYTVKTLFDAKQTKLPLLSRFSHVNDQGELILPIGKGKKMIIGKMRF